MNNEVTVIIEQSDETWAKTLIPRDIPDAIRELLKLDPNYPVLIEKGKGCCYVATPVRLVGYSKKALVRRALEIAGILIKKEEGIEL